jgi:hypothetical protein
VIFYALTDASLAGSELGEVIEFFASREQAEEALRDALKRAVRPNQRTKGIEAAT